MRTRNILTVVVAMILAGATASLAAPPPSTRPAEKLRVGTYDPRAVAVAFAASKTHEAELKDLIRQRDDAKKASDSKKVAELEKDGQARQRRLHRQGFAGAPVDDILARVKDRLPQVAADSGVSVIVAKPDFADPTVEVVDVTDNLVKLFDPTEKTLKTIRDLRSKPALTMEDVDEAEKRGM